jgi:hypothetical protein
MSAATKSIKIGKSGAIDRSLTIGDFEITVNRASHKESTVSVFVHDIREKRQIEIFEYESKAEANVTIVDLSVLLLSIKDCRNRIEFLTLRRANRRGLNDAINRLNLDSWLLEELMWYL